MTTDAYITTAADEIRSLLPCSEALEFARRFPNLNAAWLACERGDWMLWLAGRHAGEPMSDARRKLVLAACECARLALPHVKAGELRPLRAIELAERWARGEQDVSREELRAATAAYAATTAATAATAATIAAYAATADAATAAAAIAAYAATADAATASATATASTARKKTLRECADIVRRHYPEVPR